MGMRIFTKSGIFNPTDYGLAAGDVVDLIVVGGGQGGNASVIGGDEKTGGLGAASSFGAYLTANGGGPDAARWGTGNGGFILPPYGIADSRATTEFYSMFFGAGCSTSDKNKTVTPSRDGGNGYGASCGSGVPGELKFGSVVLENSDPVAVTVGGAGSGALCYKQQNSTGTYLDGNDGTSSGGGETVGIGANIHSGAGGYDNERGGDGVLKATYSYGDASAGGGGAGGIVIVFW